MSRIAASRFLAPFGDDPERLHPRPVVERPVDVGAGLLEVDQAPAEPLDHVHLAPAEQRLDLGRALVPDVHDVLPALQEAEGAVHVERIERGRRDAVGQERELEHRDRLAVHGAPAREGLRVEEVLPAAGLAAGRELLGAPAERVRVGDGPDPPVAHRASAAGRSAGSPRSRRARACRRRPAAASSGPRRPPCPTRRRAPGPSRGSWRCPARPTVRTRMPVSRSNGSKKNRRCASV